MNIYAQKGTEVVYVGTEGVHLTEEQKNSAEKNLKKGYFYTIETTEVLAWETRVHLQEFPGIYFNSLVFE